MFVRSQALLGFYEKHKKASYINLIIRFSVFCLAKKTYPTNNQTNTVFNGVIIEEEYNNS